MTNNNNVTKNDINGKGTIFSYDLFMDYLEETKFDTYIVDNYVMDTDATNCVHACSTSYYKSVEEMFECELYDNVDNISNAMLIFNLRIGTDSTGNDYQEYLYIDCLTIANSFEEELIDCMIKDLESKEVNELTGNYVLAEDVGIEVYPTPIKDMDAYEKKVDEFVAINGRLPVGDEIVIDEYVDVLKKGDNTMDTNITFNHEDTMDEKDAQIVQLLAEINLLKAKNAALVMEADYSNERVLKAEKCFKELKAAYFAEKKAKEALEKRLDKAAEVFKTLKAAYFKVKKMYKQAKGETKTNIKTTPVKTHPVAVDNAKVYDAKKSNIHVCDGCKKGLTVKASNFCKDHADKFEGKKLCFECQKKIVTPIKWNDVPVEKRHAIYDAIIKEHCNK